MDAIDANARVQQAPTGAPPSLLFLILDTSPLAWSQLDAQLPLSAAVANLLVFINAHLAFSQENRVAVLAAHCDRTYWLYPSPSSTTSTPSKAKAKSTRQIPQSSSKYRPFALIEFSILSRLNHLLSITSPASLDTSKNTTPLSGALTQALTYINGARLNSLPAAASAQPHNATPTDASHDEQSRQAAALACRILLVSTSAADLASQYISLTNAMFAAQHANVPIDVLKLAGDTALLQQAAYTTGGIFVSPDGLSSEPSQDGKPKEQVTLLPYLFRALLPDPTARLHLYTPTSPHVDFRAACFCHRRVVSTGYVCSICLSIFCEAEEVLGPGLECLTCGTKLVLGGVQGAGLATKLGGEGKDGGKEKKKKSLKAGAGPVAA